MTKEMGLGLCVIRMVPIYEGEWKDGERTGNGFLTTPDGLRHMDESNDEKKDAKGTLTKPQ